MFSSPGPAGAPAGWSSGIAPRRPSSASGVSSVCSMLRRLPVRMLIAAGVSSGPFVDSIVVSNLGRLPDPPHFDEDDSPAVWFSPPCPMPMGIGIGIVPSGGTLRVCVRYSRSRLGEAAAQTFCELFLTQLQALAPAPAQAASNGRQ